MVGVLLDKGRVNVNEAYLLIKRAYPYRGLSLEDFKAVTEFMERLGLVKLKGSFLRPAPRKAWSYYFENVSMIPDVKRFEVVDLVERRSVGSLDEEFVALRGRRGLTLILAGRVWNFVGVEEDKVYVEPTLDAVGAIPSWEGELIPVPFEVAREVGALRGRVEKANELRKKYGVDDLKLLASKLGAEVVEMPLGRIIKEMYIKDEGVIVIDPNLHPYKKRHLIAHALARHLFHRDLRANYFLDEKENRFNARKIREREREAEVFAMHLLIPEDKLNEVLKQEWVKESSDPILELAEEFQVSENFMRKEA